MGCPTVVPLLGDFLSDLSRTIPADGVYQFTCSLIQNDQCHALELRPRSSSRGWQQC